MTVTGAGITLEGQDGHGEMVAKGVDAETTVESPASSDIAVLLVIEVFIAERNERRQ